MSAIGRLKTTMEPEALADNGATIGWRFRLKKTSIGRIEFAARLYTNTYLAGLYHPVNDSQISNETTQRGGRCQRPRGFTILTLVLDEAENFVEMVQNSAFLLMFAGTTEEY